MTVFILALALLSPTLTLVRLFQQKEWRIDRLSEHLGKEHWFLQLFGIFRPAIGAVWALLITASLLLPLTAAPYDGELTLLLLILLTGIGCMQAGSRRQRAPVWTLKAIIITLLALLLPLAGAGLLLFMQSGSWVSVCVGVTALLPPLWVTLAWGIFYPVDAFMKHRIIAKAVRMRSLHPHLTVIGITGSVGKTTMKGLLEHFLKGKNAIATPERVNSEIGVARWLTTVLEKEPADSRRIVIVEMGAYRIGEIALLCRIAQPTIGVITTVGAQHLSLFGSKENIVRAKGELFASLPEDGVAFTSSDQPAFAELKTRATCRVIGVGTDHHATVQALDIEETGDGVRFKVLGTGFVSRLAGTHSVTGIAMAAAIADHLGVKPEESAKLLPSFHRMQSTFEVKTVHGVAVLDDSYNSSPESVDAAIRWAATRSERGKILLLEGIIELGDEEETIHREIAEEAEKVFDTVFLAHSRHLPYFKETMKERVHEASAGGPVKPGSLLVVCGRVNPALLKRFLPDA